jgi:integrase/recombinase XerC
VTLARTLGRISWSIDIRSPKVYSYRDTRGPNLHHWQILFEAACRSALSMKASRIASHPVGTRDVAMILLMRDHALRRASVTAFDLVDLEVNTGEPCIWMSEKGKPEKRRLTLNSRTAKAIEAWLRHRGPDPGPLFTRLDNGCPPLCRLTGEALRRMLIRLSSKADLAVPIRPHGLRHHSITQAVALTNGNVALVQKFSGHAKVETVMRYVDSLKDDASTVARMLGGETPTASSSQ